MPAGTLPLARSGVKSALPPNRTPRLVGSSADLVSCIERKFLRAPGSLPRHERKLHASRCYPAQIAGAALDSDLACAEPSRGSRASKRLRLFIGCLTPVSDLSPSESGPMSTYPPAPVRASLDSAAPLALSQPRSTRPGQTRRRELAQKCIAFALLAVVGMNDSATGANVSLCLPPPPRRAHLLEDAAPFPSRSRS